MENTISLKGLNRAEVLAVLYNASKPQGMGFLHYDPTPMTREQAQEILDKGVENFDYLKGRVMKVNLSGEELNPRGYDRNNGDGSAERAINSLCTTNQTNSGIIQATHEYGTNTEAEVLRNRLGRDKGSVKKSGELVIVHLGFDDVADVLMPKVDEAVKKLDDLNK